MVRKDEADYHLIRHKASGMTEKVGPLKLDELEKGSYTIEESFQNEKPPTPAQSNAASEAAAAEAES